MLPQEELASFTWTGLTKNASRIALETHRAVALPRAGMPSMIPKLSAVKKRWGGMKGPVMLETSENATELLMFPKHAAAIDKMDDWWLPLSSSYSL
jgi:hypothetical protein